MINQEQQLSIAIDDSISLEELQAKQAEGFSVLRSAHVGNFMPYNSTIADMGIPMLLVDHTITGVDSTYVPEAFIAGGNIDTVAAVGTLVSRTVIEHTGEFLDDAHVSRTRNIFPETAMSTYTEYLRDNEQIAGEIITIAGQEFPELFKRRLLPDGSVESFRRESFGNFAEDLADVGILQLADDPRTTKEGILIPNEVNIVANFVIEALKTQQEKQYHLSGPAMVEYITNKDKRRLLPAIYQTVVERASFSSVLPPRVDVSLVPSANAIFATRPSESSNLEAIIEAVLHHQVDLAGIAAERKVFFTDPSITKDEKRSESITFDERVKALSKVLGCNIAAFGAAELFRSVTNGQVTQYDIPQAGGLFIALENRTLPMSELAKMGNAIRKLVEVSS